MLAYPTTIVLVFAVSGVSGVIVSMISLRNGLNQSKALMCSFAKTLKKTKKKAVIQYAKVLLLVCLFVDCLLVHCIVRLFSVLPRFVDVHYMSSHNLFCLQLCLHGTLFVCTMLSHALFALSLLQQPACTLFNCALFMKCTLFA